MEKTVELEVIETILQLYNIHEQVVDQKMYIHVIEDNERIKLIFRVTLANGRFLVIKILHEDDDIKTEMKKV